MHIVLEVRSGACTGEQARLALGQQVSIGRNTRADLVFPTDAFLSGLHFLLENDDGSCWITDLNSRNGTFVNGRRVQRAELNDSDMIMAGHTIFSVHLKFDDIVPQDAAILRTSVDIALAESDPITADLERFKVQHRMREQRLLDLFHNKFQPLYVVLDGSADKRLLSCIYEEREFESLAGPFNETAADRFTVYFARLRGGSAALRFLAREGWGHGWGVYLTCPASAAELKVHLQSLREIAGHNDADEFRYYRPAVLRDYLLHCTSQQAHRCFGPIEQFLMESETPDDLLHFTRTVGGVRALTIPLSEAPVTRPRF